jgi:hypothetical protein
MVGSGFERESKHNADVQSLSVPEREIRFVTADS